MDSPRSKLKESGHKPDVSDSNHCEHCADHHRRISRVEATLGIKAQPGAAKEEAGVHKEHAPTSYDKKGGRKRH